MVSFKIKIKYNNVIIRNFYEKKQILTNNLPAVNSKAAPIATTIKQIISPEMVAPIRDERRPILHYLL